MSKVGDNIIFGDIDLLIDRFTLLTDSYRLLVGAVEELTRTPSVGKIIIEQAVGRTAFLGGILDQLLFAIQIALILDFIRVSEGVENPYV
ncbi:MAG TPA: hypothetical protein GXZ20_03885 [Halanaerobiaceae bacterium]|jgi:hypothetical protein|nr:hypothetical protein [Bacillota bacterium]HHU92265.1 hypothetical protein [Halanaerobiaceae bacterium]HOA41349.1 hypothetical protein [Halanaerobiales bacterium]HPZ63774.1 hypothetical protein [Halanaerobiales bacterium]HQD04408.1 hypothetical protein [Halanaerobiales bacterium]